MRRATPEGPPNKARWGGQPPRAPGWPGGESSAHLDYRHAAQCVAGKASNNNKLTCQKQPDTMSRQPALAIQSIERILEVTAKRPRARMNRPSKLVGKPKKMHPDRKNRFTPFLV